MAITKTLKNMLIKKLFQAFPITLGLSQQIYMYVKVDFIFDSW